MYYVFERKEGVGRPVFINGMLHEKFIEGGANVAMEYDWNFAAPPDLPAKLPEKLVLISKDKKYAFDLASDFNGQIISARLLSLMMPFGLEDWEISSLTVVNQKGVSIVDQDYFFIRLPITKLQKDIVDIEKSKLDVRKNGEIKKIWDLAIQSRSLPNIFMSNEISLINVIFIGSEVAEKLQTVRLHGFNIVPASQAGVIKPA
ncbi:Imm43 family immunity protein [Chitinimonas viridis]|uniref:Imm43 family immunity protein n=1 Tax=Chitinimonas viridis TaxID=664880 RepID=A0ABT8B1F4_9NEIS|nr:Imm43 family immunity protein [Chitinimonas viridis]MDN3575946.1 Imm43 family immunity protein [Chitinimonas viridis]